MSKKKCPNPQCVTPEGLPTPVLFAHGRCRKCGTFVNPEETATQVMNQAGQQMFIASLQRLGAQTRLQLMSRGMTRKQIDYLLKCGILSEELSPVTHQYLLKVDDDFSF